MRNRASGRLRRALGNSYANSLWRVIYVISLKNQELFLFATMPKESSRMRLVAQSGQLSTPGTAGAIP
jgi:hypothetical protein